MAATDDHGAPLSDGIDIDTVTSSRNPKSKTDQLARTRRNQQRCRERKRAHVADLEGQLRALQLKIQQCEPCASPPLSNHESMLETASRENTVRRELLVSFGVDEEAQQRYIDSAARKSTAPSPVQSKGGQTHTSEAQHDLDSAQEEICDSVLGNNVSLGYDQGSYAAGVTNDFSGAMEPVDDNWLFAAVDKLGPNSLGVDSWLPASNGIATIQNNHPNTATAIETTPSNTPDLFPEDYFPFGNEQLPKEKNDSMERCFLDSVVRLESSDSCTPCSKALSLIFRLNRRGWSMAKLQKSLKEGVRPAAQASQECCIEDTVLFKVLVEISSS